MNTAFGYSEHTIKTMNLKQSAIEWYYPREILQLSGNTCVFICNQSSITDCLWAGVNNFKRSVANKWFIQHFHVIEEAHELGRKILLQAYEWNYLPPKHRLK